MRRLDRILQRWRGCIARPWIPEGARVLDIGCHRGEFLASLAGRIRPSIGFDPGAPPDSVAGHTLIRDYFREPAPLPDGSFDAIVLLATLEHIPGKDPIARECARLLRPAGRVILTVPSPLVDRIVSLLGPLRLLDGMALEEHHGFDPEDTPRLFMGAGLELEYRGYFQLALNNLFVFRKPGKIPTEGECPESEIR